MIAGDEALIAADLIPFVECDHGEGPVWTPAHYHIGKAMPLISCVVCLAIYDSSDLHWYSAAEAQRNFGWKLVEHGHSS